MFSIIIPLYNKEKSISKTIDSVLKQKFIKFELIVVNDGSTDSGPAIVKGFKDSRIMLINQKNSGVSATRNSGVKSASYKWIAFLDADDIWKEEYLEVLSNYINKVKNIKFIASGFATCNINKDIIKEYVISYTSGFYDYFSLSNKIQYSVIHTSAVCLRREIFIQNKGFNKKLTHGEDKDLWERIASSNELFFINRVLTYYQVDAENRAMNKLPNLNKTRVYNLNLREISDKEQIVYFTNNISGVLISCLFKKNFNRAFKLYKKHSKDITILMLFKTLISIIKRLVGH